MTLPTKEIILAPREGNSLAIGINTLTFKAIGDDTHGHLGLFEMTQEPGGMGASPHLHREMEELFYVLEGEVDILVGDRTIKAQAGAFVLVPRSTTHAFTNRGTERARLLVMFCPGGEREKYFEGLAELTQGGQKPDPQALIELMRQFDQEPVDVNF